MKKTTTNVKEHITMDYKKLKADSSARTHNMSQFSNQTGNVYETIAMLSKRANQISNDIKDELNRKIDEFATNNDNLEEIFENQEQIEVSRFYEQLPKPTLLAIEEYEQNKLVYRNNSRDNKSNEENI